MAEVPGDLRYTAEHEWVRAGDGSRTVRVGITDYAQQALGDVVFVSLPDVGATVSAGAVVGEIESTKSVSELFAPVSGTVAARNDALDDQPELINSQPYGDGWLFDVELTDSSDGTDGSDALTDLLDAAAYGLLT